MSVIPQGHMALNGSKPFNGVPQIQNQRFDLLRQSYIGRNKTKSQNKSSKEMQNE